MIKDLLYPLALLFGISCTPSAGWETTSHSPNLPSSAQNTAPENTKGYINPEGMTVGSRINPPASYKRVLVEPNSYGNYLRNLPLKKEGSPVLYFDGSKKRNFNVYEAVVDLPIGKKDLHQCADAVMRLRGQYLYEQGKYDKIHFNFTNGFRVDYKEWMKGMRMVVKGNNTYWSLPGTPSNTPQDFWKYMELIFTYAGTLSLSKELDQIEVADLRIGDVFILGGSPGHAVIVVDMARHVETGGKLFLLAQSYMPAQELQILANPIEAGSGPWYSENFGDQLITPEWVFTRHQLMRFPSE